MFEIYFLVRDVAVQFGGLLFWPLFRTWEPDNQRRMRFLRLVFFCHVALAGAIILWLGVELTLHSLRVFQTRLWLDRLGMVSIVASIVVVLLTRQRGDW